MSKDPNSEIKCYEITRRELDGVYERAEFAQKLLGDVSREAWQSSEKDDDARTGLAKLMRKQAQELKKFMDDNAHELKWGKQDQRQVIR